MKKHLSTRTSILLIWALVIGLLFQPLITNACLKDITKILSAPKRAIVTKVIVNGSTLNSLNKICIENTNKKLVYKGKKKDKTIFLAKGKYILYYDGLYCGTYQIDSSHTTFDVTLTSLKITKNKKKLSKSNSKKVYLIANHTKKKIKSKNGIFTLVKGISYDIYYDRQVVSKHKYKAKAKQDTYNIKVYKFSGRVEGISPNDGPGPYANETFYARLYGTNCNKKITTNGSSKYSTELVAGTYDFYFVTAKTVRSDIIKKNECNRDFHPYGFNDYWPIHIGENEAYKNSSYTYFYL